jgi:hypothetical protein
MSLLAHALLFLSQPFPTDYYYNNNNNNNNNNAHALVLAIAQANALGAAHILTRLLSRTRESEQQA